jgi:hypothetical protein
VFSRRSDGGRATSARQRPRPLRRPATHSLTTAEAIFWAQHVAGIERLAVDRLAGLAVAEHGTARHRVGIDGLAAERRA